MREFLITKGLAVAFAMLASWSAASAHDRLDARAEFVALSKASPEVVQDIRYATRENVLGRPLRGYEAAKCILRARTAAALMAVQATLARKGYGLSVFDCYRPVRAVQDLLSYVSDGRSLGQSVYHPHVPARAVVQQGYIASHSGHSTGLAVDLTLIRLDGSAGSASPTACGGATSPEEVDMGTGFDCFDPQAGADATNLTAAQRSNRAILASAMAAAGFRGYAREWWHFFLPPLSKAERQEFDFVIR